MTRRKKSNTNRASRPPQAQPAAPPPKSQRQWYKVDLHLHTPASRDYEDPQATYLEWLRVAAERSLDIVAITDHNTVAGIGAIRREIEWLMRLERENRLTDEERHRLNEWRALSDSVLVLPGFEFTATFGFHVLAIFSPETSVRQLEHVLLKLNVAAERLDDGTTETGAATDVLTGYRVIHEAGGLVIAAHANSTHGVAMRDFPFGGQTKIAYTQDANLDALEVTDLERQGRSTVRFFNGSKSEYARRMHCIQGSDAHSLYANPRNPKRLGIGDRATEMLLDEPSFEAIKNLLQSKSFDRTRPARPKDRPFDPIAAAREEGPTLVQSFHESASERGGRLATILNDVCAFANTAGGAIYVGVSHRKGKPKGLPDPQTVQQEIGAALQERFSPPLEVKFDILLTEEAKVLRVQVPKGPDRPYCIDGQKFYVRDETESDLAARDEIVALVLDVQAERDAKPGRRGRDRRPEAAKPPRGEPVSPPANGRSDLAVDMLPVSAETITSSDAFYLPQIGVEIVETEDRQGTKYHSIRDLRNGTVIKNVTRKGARKLWSYAIQQREDHPLNPETVKWQGNVGLIGVETRAGKRRYDLALRENGTIRVFYGVTEDGMEGPWSAFIQEE